MKKRLHTIHQGIYLTIEYDENVYQPGILTSTLSDIMEVRPGDRVIDVGCGTGYLGIVASLLGASEVVAIDPMPEAISWTEHNARLNGVQNLKAIRGEALDPVSDGEVDIIITNPPQIPYPRNFSPWRYGGPEGTDVIVKIIMQACQILSRKGRLFLVHSALAHPAKVRELLSRCGFQWRIVTTVEKELDPDTINLLAPQLTDYLLRLAHQGMAEIHERKSRHYYNVWFYRAEL